MIKPPRALETEARKRQKEEVFSNKIGVLTEVIVEEEHSKEEVFKKY